MSTVTKIIEIQAFYQETYMYIPDDILGCEMILCDFGIMIKSPAKETSDALMIQRFIENCS